MLHPKEAFAFDPLGYSVYKRTRLAMVWLNIAGSYHMPPLRANSWLTFCWSVSVELSMGGV
jgi:hypothetical protein